MASPVNRQESVQDGLASRLAECETALDYRFTQPSLLEHALTHASVARTRLASNERLEFLGDAVLGMVACELLFQRFPESPEGELTRIKSILVSRSTCAEFSRQLGLDRFVIVGKGLGTGDGIPTSILGAVFEAVVAVIYLDGGLAAARRFLERCIIPEAQRVSVRDRGRNFKSQLQHLAQKRFGATPCYRVLDEQGPDHSKCFQMIAMIGETAFPPAWGASKKEAEQSAAEQALSQLAADDADHDSRGS